MALPGTHMCGESDGPFATIRQLIGVSRFLSAFSNRNPRRVSGDQAIGNQRLHRYHQVRTTHNGASKRPLQLHSRIASFCETTRGTIDARVPPDTCAQQCLVPRPTQKHHCDKTCRYATLRMFSFEKVKLFRRNRGLSTGNSHKVGGHNNVRYRGPQKPTTRVSHSDTRRFESRLLQIGLHFGVTVTNDARDPPSTCVQQ